MAGRIPGAEIAVVLSDKPGAPGLEAARALGLAARHVPPPGRDTQLIAALHEHHVDLVCLAGYMRIISPAFVAAFPERILNVHPSLLPSFPGLEAQQQALDFGAKVSGCTVHFVDERVDHGVILLQRAVPVHDTDTPETLSTRILAEEHLAYPEAIALVLAGTHDVRARRYLPKLPRT